MTYIIVNNQEPNDLKLYSIFIATVYITTLTYHLLYK